jgi:outer membrane biogenesis lipoprotein LolB
VRRAAAVFAALLSASTALTACSGPAARPPETDKTRLTYVVVPHPDDELQAWALLE